MSVNATPSASPDRRAAVVRIFDAICAEGPVARTSLRFAVQASPSTITTAVQELIARRFVVEVGTGESTGGRRPKILDLTPELGGVIAIDVGGINVRVAAGALRGTLTATAKKATPRSDRPERLRAVLNGLIDDVRAAINGPVR